MAMQPATAFPVATPGHDSELDTVAQSILSNPDPEGGEPTPEDSRQEPAPEPEDLDADEAEDLASEDDADELDDDPQESDDDEQELEADADDDEDLDDDQDETVDLDEIEVKVDGQIHRVTLEELKRDYSGRQAIDARIQQATEAKQAAEAQVGQLQQHAEQAHQLAQMAMQVIGEEAADPEIDWEALYEVDPTEWAHQRELQRAKQEKAQGRMAQLQQAVQQNATNAQQHSQSQLQEVIVAEATTLRDAVPVFQDAQAGPKHREKLIEFAVERYGKYGLTPEVIDSVQMAVPLIMLNELFEMTQDKGSKAVKNQKRRRMKRNVRPGTGTGQTDNQRSKKRQDRLRKRAEETGHPDDVAALMLQTK